MFFLRFLLNWRSLGLWNFSKYHSFTFSPLDEKQHWPFHTSSFSVVGALFHVSDDVLFEDAAIFTAALNQGDIDLSSDEIDWNDIQDRRVKEALLTLFSMAIFLTEGVASTLLTRNSC